MITGQLKPSLLFFSFFFFEKTPIHQLVITRKRTMGTRFTGRMQFRCTFKLQLCSYLGKYLTCLGYQIIGPHDRGIANAIKDNLIPRTWDMHTFETSPHLHYKTGEMQNAYYSYLRDMSHSRFAQHLLVYFSSSFCRRQNYSTTVKFTSTAMHGVGNSFAAKAFDVFGFPPFIPVDRQKDPDPDFPTVKFPNPEEKGQTIFSDDYAT